MLNLRASYPYPLLRPEPLDYKESIFKSGLDIMREEDGFSIVPSFSTENSEVQQLIDEGFATYALQIRCKTTWYRDFIIIKDNQREFISSTLLHDRVELYPCIIMLKNFPGFKSSDFIEAYGDQSFDLSKSDVIGIGIPVYFKAYYESDEIKEPNSIITIDKIDNEEYIKVLLDNPDGNIHVQMPEEQYQKYMNIGTYGNSNKVALLHTTVHIPVIVFALQAMRYDDEDSPDTYSTKGWYKSLETAMLKLCNGNQNEVDELLNDPLNAAERLLRNNMSDALTIIDTTN